MEVPKDSSNIVINKTSDETMGNILTTSSENKSESTEKSEGTSEIVEKEDKSEVMDITDVSIETSNPTNSSSQTEDKTQISSSSQDEEVEVEQFTKKLSAQDINLIIMGKPENVDSPSNDKLTEELWQATKPESGIIKDDDEDFEDIVKDLETAIVATEKYDSNSPQVFTKNDETEDLKSTDILEKCDSPKSSDTVDACLNIETSDPVKVLQNIDEPRADIKNTEINESAPHKHSDTTTFSESEVNTHSGFVEKIEEPKEKLVTEDVSSPSEKECEQPSTSRLDSEPPVEKVEIIIEEITEETPQDIKSEIDIIPVVEESDASPRPAETFTETDVEVTTKVIGDIILEETVQEIKENEEVAGESSEEDPYKPVEIQEPVEEIPIKIGENIDLVQEKDIEVKPTVESKDTTISDKTEENKLEKEVHKNSQEEIVSESNIGTTVSTADPIVENIEKSSLIKLAEIEVKPTPEIPIEIKQTPIVAETTAAEKKVEVLLDKKESQKQEEKFSKQTSVVEKEVPVTPTSVQKIEKVDKGALKVEEMLQNFEESMTSQKEEKQPTKSEAIPTKSGIVETKIVQPIVTEDSKPNKHPLESKSPEKTTVSPPKKIKLVRSKPKLVRPVQPTPKVIEKVEEKPKIVPETKPEPIKEPEVPKVEPFKKEVSTTEMSHTVTPNIKSKIESEPDVSSKSKQKLKLTRNYRVPKPVAKQPTVTTAPTPKVVKSEPKITQEKVPPEPKMEPVKESVVPVKESEPQDEKVIIPQKPKEESELCSDKKEKTPAPIMVEDSKPLEQVSTEKVSPKPEEIIKTFESKVPKGEPNVSPPEVPKAEVITEKVPQIYEKMETTPVMKQSEVKEGSLIPMEEKTLDVPTPEVPTEKVEEKAVQSLPASVSKEPSSTNKEKISSVLEEKVQPQVVEVAEPPKIEVQSTKIEEPSVQKELELPEKPELVTVDDPEVKETDCKTEVENSQVDKSVPQEKEPSLQTTLVPEVENTIVQETENVPKEMEIDVEVKEIALQKEESIPQEVQEPVSEVQKLPQKDEPIPEVESSIPKEIQSEDTKESISLLEKSVPTPEETDKTTSAMDSSPEESVTEVAPSVEEKTLSSQIEEPDVKEQSVSVMETIPEKKDTILQMPEAILEAKESVPEITETVEAVKEACEPKTQSKETEPKVTETVPKVKEVISQEIDVVSEEVKITPQVKEPELPVQESVSQPEEPIAQPEEPVPQPEKPVPQPEEPVSKPEKSVSEPQKSDLQAEKEVTVTKKEEPVQKVPQPVPKSEEPTPKVDKLSPQHEEPTPRRTLRNKKLPAKLAETQISPKQAQQPKKKAVEKVPQVVQETQEQDSETSVSVPKVEGRALRSKRHIQDPLHVSCGSPSPKVEILENQSGSPKVQEKSNLSPGTVTKPLHVDVNTEERPELKLTLPKQRNSPKIRIKPIVKPPDEPGTSKATDNVPKLTIKPVVKTTEPLKITITKQSDETHSILKIYKPEEQQSQETVPKLTIKSIPKSDESSGVEIVPKLTIKSVPKPEEPSSSEVVPKLTIKTVPKPEETQAQHSPRRTTRNIKILSPGITVKSVEPTPKEAQTNYPKVTIKPVLKPDDKVAQLSPRQKIKALESSGITMEPVLPNKETQITPLKISGKQIPKEEPSTSKVSKPITKTCEIVHSEDGTSSPLRLTIKPIMQSEQSYTSPKLTIKPVLKPEETKKPEEDEKQERIVLKIPKNNIPSPKERAPKKDPEAKPTEPQSTEPDKNEKLGKIKLKLTKEGSHAQIIPSQLTENSLKRTIVIGESGIVEKRSRTDDVSDVSINIVESSNNKNISLTSLNNEVTIEKVQPSIPVSSSTSMLSKALTSPAQREESSKLKDMLLQIHQKTEITCTQVVPEGGQESNDSDDVKIIGIIPPEGAKQDPISINESSNSEDVVIISEVKSEVKTETKMETEPTPAPEPVAKPEPVVPVTPAPKKRGRPRKNPIEVKPEIINEPVVVQPEPELEPVDDEEEEVIEVRASKRHCRTPAGREPYVPKAKKARGGKSPRGRGRPSNTRNTMDIEDEIGVHIITPPKQTTTTPTSTPTKSPRGKGRKGKKYTPKGKNVAASPLIIDQITLDESNDGQESLGHQATGILGTPTKSHGGSTSVDPSTPFSTPMKEPESPRLTTPLKSEGIKGAEPVQGFEEETRMSASENNSRAQTPARQFVVPPPSEGPEESQSSIISSATTESNKNKKGRLEILDLDSHVTTVEQIAEYYWNDQGPFMLQEQIAQYLGVKSFKRKYPGLSGRRLEMQERDFIREKGLVSESLCDMGLTAVPASEILDIMYTDFQEKYEEYRKFMRDKQSKEISNRQKAISLATTQEKNKLDFKERAVQDAANWNLNFNKTRQDSRPCFMDLQTYTINYPQGKMKAPQKPKIGHYPIALVPGQYTDYYKTYTPTELNYFPLNTVRFGPIFPNQHLMDDEKSESGNSDSDSSSGSDSDSSDSDSSSDEEEVGPETKPINGTSRGTLGPSGTNSIILSSMANAMNENIQTKPLSINLGVSKVPSPKVTTVN